MKKKIVYISAICILIDQISKALLNHALELNQSINVIPSFFSITYVRNEGAAWSLFAGNQFFLILMSFLALYIIYTYFLKNKTLNQLEICSYGLLLGGIFGNLIDRLIRRYVIDFFDFTIFNYHFPVFNIADICIVIGVFFTIISLWKGERNGNHRSNRKCQEN